MTKTKIIIFLSLISLSAIAQKPYKELIKDLSINFYDVCKEAEAHFEKIDISVKGSGWKGYQRWKNANEYKYFPDGVRSQTDPFFVENAYLRFKSANPKALFTNGWHELGPYRIDSISGHYAAGLGRVEDFYVDPTDANRIYLGSRSGGFWKTTDGGNNWQGGATDFLVASGVNTIAVSPTNSDSILINVQNSNNQNSHGIYRSIDGGNTFIESNFNPTNVGQGGLGSNFKIYIIAYHPTIPNLIFVGTNKGIYRSADNLATWTSLYTSGDITQIAFHPTNPNIVYIYDDYYWGVNEDYVLRSTNAGVSYTQSNQIIGNNEYSARLSVSNDCANCLYFASDLGIWKSIDDGINFTFLSNPNEGCGGFAVNDNDTSKMIYGYVDIDKSSDGGLNFVDATKWSLGNTNGAGNGHQQSFETSTNYVHADLNIAKSISGVFYGGTDGFLVKSTDNGTNWSIISQGTAIRENYKLGVSQSNHFRSVSGSQDNGASIKLQDNWLEFYGADGMECLIHPLNDDWMITSFQNGGRRRTKNAGQSQDGVSPSGQSGSGNAAWEAPIAYDPNNQMRIFNFSDSVYVSEDFGSNWVYRGIPSSFTGIINQAAIAENNSDIIIITNNDDIDKSTDGGATFSSIKGILPSYYIEDVAFDPKNDDVIIVVYARYQNDNKKVYKTTDGGINWSNITYNLNDMPIHSVVIDHTNASNIYLGGEIGVYTMPMNGTNWQLYNPNLPNMTVEELEIVNGSNTLKAATWGRGLWEFSLVGRNNFPAIITTKITDQPTDNSPKITRNQFVTSTISYENTLTSVYLEWSANTPTFGNIISMSNTQDSTWISDLALPQYPIGTKMYFKVFAVGNNNDTSETYKFMYTIYPYEYCASSGTMQYQGNITLVDFNTINKATGKTLAYSDYTATDSTKVIQNKNYNLTINLNTDNGNYEYFSNVWIDWNQDADFEDTDEKYILGSTTNNTNGATNLSPLTISIPNHALVGATRMRVSCKYSDQPDVCSNGFDGEVEDYKIIVVAEPNLSLAVNKNSFCLGEKVKFSYTGSALDNLSWTISNGLNTFTSTNFSDSLVLLNTGTYNISISTNFLGQNYTFDSVAVFKVFGPNSFTLNNSSCNPTDTGVFVQTLTNVNGCDSVLTTITSFQNFDTLTIYKTSCLEIEIGTKIDSLTNKFGCDSLVTTITSKDQIMATIIANGTSLQANPSGADYLWLDCNKSFTAISGANSQNFTSTQNGDYAVKVSFDACIDTSECFKITGIGILENNLVFEVKIHPNPTSGKLQIEFSETVKNINLRLENNIGQLIKQLQINQQNQVEINFENESKGIYFLSISEEKKKAVFKIVKN